MCKWGRERGEGRPGDIICKKRNDERKEFYLVLTKNFTMGHSYVTI